MSKVFVPEEDKVEGHPEERFLGERREASDTSEKLERVNVGVSVFLWGNMKFP